MMEIVQHGLDFYIAWGMISPILAAVVLHSQEMKSTLIQIYYYGGGGGDGGDDGRRLMW